MIRISRKDAKAQGLKYYFTGRVCKRGHVAEHRIGGSCKVCEAVTAKERHEKDKHKQRIYRYRHQRLSPDKHPVPTRPEPPRCECCGDAPSGRYTSLCLDHCHETGKFRGYLCFKCNTAIGKLGDDFEGVLNALSYLARAK